MQLIVLGLNHKTAPVEIRERFNFSQDKTVRVLRRLINNDNINEAVLLSTCNRTELYLVLEDAAAGAAFCAHYCATWLAGNINLIIFTT